MEEKRLRCELRASKETVSSIQADLDLANENSNIAYAELKTTREALPQAQEGLESLQKALKESRECEAEEANQVKLREEELASTLRISSYLLILPFTRMVCAYG